MTTHSVFNCTFIIRSQAEYSELSQTMSVRHILEIPTMDRHLGFVDIEALLTVLRTELMALQGHKHINPEQKEDKS